MAFPSTGLRFVRRHPLLVASGAVFIAGTLFLREPVLERYQRWDAERRLSRAVSLAASRQWPAVLKETKTLGARFGSDYSWIRMRVEASVRTNEPLTNRLLTAAFLHPEATLSDRAEYLALARDGGDLVTFATLYNLLDSDQRADPAIVREKGRLLLGLGRHAEVVSLVSERLAAGEIEPALRLQLVAALVAAGDSEDSFLLAQRIAVSLVEGGETEGYEAFRLLGRVPLRFWNPEVIPVLENWLRRQESVSVEERLIVERARMATLPEEDRETFAREVADRYGAQHPGAVAEWLVSVGLGEEADAWFDPDEFRLSREQYERRFRALVAAGNWEKARIGWQNPRRSSTRSTSGWLVPGWRGGRVTRMPGGMRSSMPSFPRALRRRGMPSSRSATRPSGWVTTPGPVGPR